MMDRERLIRTVEAILRGTGYKTARMEFKGSCFDIVASRLFVLLFIKVTTNIDTVTEEQAEDLKRLASFFRASPVSYTHLTLPTIA
jgi:putative transcriptional regulator